MDIDLKNKNQTINIEIDLILQAIYNKFGYDFRNYAKAHVKRRIKRRLAMTDCGSISEMQ